MAENVIRPTPARAALCFFSICSHELSSSMPEAERVRVVNIKLAISPFNSNAPNNARIAIIAEMPIHTNVAKEIFFFIFYHLNLL